ncbi:FmdB family zinc ribbon protein [Athalassotoga sp.]|uniref:FmdB family zinc ribbon protein n=2 Tax=Athalassotoga sp. TaxID=2022597 RepID=UPI003D0372D5
MEAIEMPLYRYVCPKCGHEEVLLKKFSEADGVKCEVCGSKMIRQMGNLETIVFKGNGYYTTDFKKSPAGSSTK